MSPSADPPPRRHLPLLRVAAGFGLAVLTLLVLVQSLVLLAVDEVTDDYLRRFMGGTVEMLAQDLAPLDAAARAQRVRELDERFAYPVLLLDAAGVQALDTAARERLARGELVVRGLNRKVLAPLPGDGQVLELGPLDPDWNPEHRLNLPRALWLQLAAALALALTVGLLAWWLLRPAWRDLRALRRAADALAAGRFEAPLPALRSRLFAPLGRGMRATLERLAGALAAQRELTGAVSHELRTPLARLRFGIDALVDEDDRAARERAVAACERDIEELDALIDASLTLARLDMGALRAAPQPGDLAALLAQEAAGFAPLLDRKSLATDLRLPEPLPFDARLLPYAVRNGLRNAARHARARIELRAWTEPASSAAPAQVCIAVDDDGPGVPAAQREAVFAPFRRLDEKAGRAGRGYGLGLAIVRRVVESHGGRAIMEDSPLGGARLRLSWPVQALLAEADASA
ncbi:MAG: two-component sensor histidine kinase [Burkholderiales bacterium]|nr:two-component sensor histidine kinase [Burkholderiales bacterium]MCA3227795.1 two-component sensor histidine kinase [Burkholderiales bacterium]